MKKKLLVGIILVVLLIVAVGCGVSQAEHESAVAGLEAQLVDAQGEVARLEAELIDSQGETAELETQLVASDKQIQGLELSLAGSEASVTELENRIVEMEQQSLALEEQVSRLSSELDTKIDFPRGFSSVSELENWVRQNKQPVTNYLEEWFRSALAVQQAGLEDGYLISVMYDEDDTDPDYGWVFNAALVNGSLYYWYPDGNEVFSYDWLRR